MSWAADNGPDAAFWFTDLASRYLDLQRDALRRGVEIRRIFVFESPESMQTPRMRQVVAMQRGIGIDVRMLDVSQVTAGVIANIVLFDGEISHEIAPALWRDTDQLTELTTRLVLAPAAVGSRALRFEELWEVAASV